MDKKEILTEISKIDRRMTILAWRKNNYINGYELHSVGKVLDILGDSEREINPTELCHLLGVSTPRITIILKTMEKEGLIERVHSPLDKRKIIVAPTKKGTEQILRRKEKNFKFFEKVYDKLGPDDAEAMLRSLHAVEEVYEEVCSEISQRIIRRHKN